MKNEMTEMPLTAADQPTNEPPCNPAGLGARRNGKIARLPHAIRMQLNHRLNDGQYGLDLLAWLNDLPEVKQVLEKEFGGRPISEQNLSQWRNGGFAEWAHYQSACEPARNMTEHAEELDQTVKRKNFADQMALVYAGQLLMTLNRLMEEETAEKRMKHLESGLRRIEQMRRGDRQAAGMVITQEKWERQKRLDRDAEMEESRRQLRTEQMLMVRDLLMKVPKDDEADELHEALAQEFTHCIEHELPWDKPMAWYRRVMGERGTPAQRGAGNGEHGTPGKTVKPDDAAVETGTAKASKSGKIKVTKSKSKRRRGKRGVRSAECGIPKGNIQPPTPIDQELADGHAATEKGQATWHSDDESTRRESEVVENEPQPTDSAQSMKEPVEPSRVAGWMTREETRLYSYFAGCPVLWLNPETGEDECIEATAFDPRWKTAIPRWKAIRSIASRAGGSNQ